MPAATHDASGVQRRHGMSSSKYKNTPRLELKQNALSLGSNVCIQHLNHLRFTWCCLQSSPPLFNLTDCSSCVRIDIQPQNPTAYTWTNFHIDISVAEWQLQKILDIGYLYSFLSSFILHCLLKSCISFYFSSITPIFPYTLLPLFAYFKHVFLPLCFLQCKPSHSRKCR